MMRVLALSAVGRLVPMASVSDAVSAPVSSPALMRGGGAYIRPPLTFAFVRSSLRGGIRAPGPLPLPVVFPIFNGFLQGSKLLLSTSSELSLLARVTPPYWHTLHRVPREQGLVERKSVRVRA